MNRMHCRGRLQSLLSPSTSRRGRQCHTFALTGGMDAETVDNSRYGMCLISRWPACRNEHLFIVERAICVISRYPFFDFLSFTLRNIAEHDRAWMTERLSKLQVLPELAMPKQPLSLPGMLPGLKGR